MQNEFLFYLVFVIFPATAGLGLWGVFNAYFCGFSVSVPVEGSASSRQKEQLTDVMVTLATN